MKQQKQTINNKQHTNIETTTQRTHNTQRTTNNIQQTTTNE